MFSLRLLAVFAFLAIATAFPKDKEIPRPVTTITDDDIDDGTWFTFPGFGNLFTPFWKLFPSFNEIGPRVVIDNDKFQVVINVKNYKKSDLKVKIKNDLIFVEGQHERDLLSMQFFHTYSLPENATAADVTAELSSDSFLIVSAPLNANQNTTSGTSDREVPITETNTPFKTSTTEKPVEKTTAIVDDDDRKEPTTASPNEVATDKDNANSIPHGNEVSP